MERSFYYGLVFIFLSSYFLLILLLVLYDFVFSYEKWNCKLNTRAFVLKTVNRTSKIRQHMCPSTYEISTHRIGPWNNIMYLLPFTIIDSYSWNNCKFCLLNTFCSIYSYIPHITYANANASFCI